MEEMEISLFAKLPTGRSVPIQLMNTDTVETVKAILSDTGGIPMEEQEIYYGDKPLQDSKQLFEYNIKNESVIVVKTKENLASGSNNNGSGNKNKKKDKKGKGKSKAEPAPPPPAPVFTQVWRVDTINVTERGMLYKVVALVFRLTTSLLHMTILDPALAIYRPFHRLVGPPLRAIYDFLSIRFSSISLVVRRALGWLNRLIYRIIVNVILPPVRSALRKIWDFARRFLWRPTKYVLTQTWKAVEFTARKTGRGTMKTLRFVGRVGERVIVRPIRYISHHLENFFEYVGDKVIRGGEIAWRYAKVGGEKLWRGVKFAGRGLRRLLDFLIWKPLRFVGRGAKHVGRGVRKALRFVFDNAWKGVKFVSRGIRKALTFLIWDPSRFVGRKVWAGVKYGARKAWDVAKAVGRITKMFVMDVKRLISYSITFITTTILRPYFLPIFRHLSSLSQRALNTTSRVLSLFLRDIGRIIRLSFSFSYHNLLYPYLLAPLKAVWISGVVPSLKFVGRKGWAYSRPGRSLVAYATRKYVFDPYWEVYYSTFQDKLAMGQVCALGINPGVTLRKTTDTIYVQMKDQTKYSIFLQNFFHVPFAAIVWVDQEEIGIFALPPHSSIIIERPIDRQECFTFVKDDQAPFHLDGADVLGLNQGRGVVKVSFAYTVDTSTWNPRQQPRSQRSNGRAQERLMAPAAIEEEMDGEPAAAAQAPTHVGGRTAYTGRSNQAMHTDMWRGELTGPSINLHAVLVARL